MIFEHLKLADLSVEQADFPDERHNLVTWTKLKTTGILR